MIHEFLHPYFVQNQSCSYLTHKHISIRGTTHCNIHERDSNFEHPFIHFRGEF